MINIYDQDHVDDESWSWRLKRFHRFSYIAKSQNFQGAAQHLDLAVDLPRPRYDEIRYTSEFSAMEKQLRETIRGNI